MLTPSPCLLIQIPIGKAISFFPAVSSHQEISWASVRQVVFSLLCYNFISGPMWLGLWWLLALWGFELPSIQRNLGGLIAGQCKSFISIPRYSVTWGSNKFEFVISSLSVLWILGASIHFCIWFQFHTSGETYLLAFLGYIYGPLLGIKKQLASSQTFHVLSIVPTFP